MASRRTAELAEALRQRFFSQIHLGVLQPGSKLPSTRELAGELGVDWRVVLAAYRELEREGLVELRERSGIYFAPGRGAAGGNGVRPEDVRVVRWLADVLAEGLTRGVPVPALPDRLHGWTAGLRLRAVCIECNDDQLTALCAELSGDYGLETVAADVDALLAAEELPSHVRRADLLVTTPFHAGEVQAIAARAGKPWVAASLRADVYAEIARLLPAGPVYFVVTDPRFAMKLGRIFAHSAGAANLHVLVAGRDDAGRIPPDAPTYVTRRARERLREADLLQRVAPEERAFSAASAREILTFIVGANVAALAARGSA
jgi:DNA-binding transcriptional ArsR family regulator